MLCATHVLKKLNMNEVISEKLMCSCYTYTIRVYKTTQSTWDSKHPITRMKLMFLCVPSLLQSNILEISTLSARKDV